MPLVIDAMHLKDVLRNIQTDRANLVDGWLLSSSSSKPALLAHRDAGGGPVHSINCGREKGTAGFVSASDFARFPAIGSAG